MTVNQATPPRWALAALCSAFAWACAPEPAAETPTATEGTGEPRSPLVIGAGAEIDPASVAARVGDSVITLQEVRREAATLGLVEAPEALAPGDPVFREVLADLIDQRLLALEAVRRGLQDEPEARRRLAAAQERILGNVLVETEVSAAVTEEAIERVYREQSRLAPGEREVRARHILVDTRAEADEVARLLADGADFGQLAARVSQDLATRFDGGDLGYFTADGIVPEFARVAFDTDEGATSAPFQTEYGWHVLRVTDRRAQPQPSLEAMRPDIVRFLTLQGIDGLLETIRETHPVTITAAPAPDALRTEDVSDRPDDGAPPQR